MMLSRFFSVLFMFVAQCTAEINIAGATPHSMLSEVSKFTGQGWLSEAFGEAAYTFMAFLAAGVFMRSIKQHGITKKSKQVAKCRNIELTSNDGIVFPAKSGEGSRFVRPLPTGTPNNTRSRSVYLPSAESDAFASAIRAGRADELPRLIDVALARASAAGVQGSLLQDLAAQYLLSTLRGCVARRHFSEAVAIYEHLARFIGDRGCLNTWSLLLYSAVESENYAKCGTFFKRLLGLGVPSCNDFVNAVRFYVRFYDDHGITQLLHIVHEKGFVLDPITRNRAMSVCVGAGAMGKAEVLADDKLFDIPMDTIGYNTLMKGYAKAGKWANCFALYEKMLTESLASEVTFGIMLDACIEAHEFERAKGVFTDLRVSGHRINVVHYTTFIKGLSGAGQFDDALKVLEEMGTTPDCKPDLVTYSTLIKAFSDIGRVMESIRILEKMLAQGVVPDAIVFNIVLAGLCVKTCGSEQIFHVFNWLVHHGLQPSSTTLSIMIKALARSHAFEPALELVENAAKWTTAPLEPRIFSQLAHACAKANNGAFAVKAYAELAKNASRSGTYIDEATNTRLYRICSSCGQATMASQIHRVITEAGGYVECADIDKLMKEAKSSPSDGMWR